MAIAGGDLTRLAPMIIADYARNDRIDSITIQHPYLDMLMKGEKKLRPGPNQVIQVRKGFGSNFAYNKGEATITFNKRDTTEQATTNWTATSEGFYLPWDELFHAGIEVNPDAAAMGKLRPTKNDMVILTDVMQQHYEDLKDGYKDRLNKEVHRDGTQNADAIPCLDALISKTPAVGSVHGLDPATRTYWRNYFAGSVATVNLAQTMENAWQHNIRNNSGKSPDFIMMGTTALNAYRSVFTLTQNTDAGQAKRIDAGVGTGIQTGLYFKGVEVLWNPVFQTLDTEDAPLAANLWEKRIYFITKSDMLFENGGIDIYSPASPHNMKATYVALNHRFRLSVKKRNSHSLIIVA